MWVQPCRKSNVRGWQSNEASVIMLALIPVAAGAGGIGGGPIQTHATTLSQARGFAFTISISAGSEIQEGGRGELGKRKKKNLLVYLRRWDKTTSAALKWTLDRYRPSSSHSPLPSPFVIEGVSVTLLIVCSGARSRPGRAASNLLIAVLAELSRFVLH